MKLTYVRDPGYVMDLLYVFFLHYNSNECLDLLINPEKKQDDTLFVREIASRFGSCPEELSPFFYYKDNSFCFLMHYFYGEGNDGIKNANVDEVFETLDQGPLISALFAFYFPDETPEGKSLEDIAALIRGSSYPETLRYRLLNLFVEPEGLHRLLIEELRAKEPILRKYYAEHKAELLRAQGRVTEEEVRRVFSSRERFLDFSKVVELPYTLCLLDKNTIQIAGGLLALGCDFIASFDAYEKLKRLPDLVRMGKVFSEENRRKILNMIIEAGELCTTEISGQLSSSVTVVYYHLEMMASEGLLASRTEGRTIYYRVDPGYFYRSSELMLQYGRRVEESQKA